MRIAYRIRPVLSWKKSCRSPLLRDTTASEVSLRIIGAAGVISVGRGDGGLECEPVREYMDDYLDVYT